MTQRILIHKDITVQDVWDSMSASQKEAAEIIIGAAIEGDGTDVSGEETVVNMYDSMTEAQHNVIDFIVGGLLSKDSSVEHSDILDDSLVHFGIKGMQWGVRRTPEQLGHRPSGGQKSARLSKKTSQVEIKEARAKVKAGTGTLGDAHKAALKSTGHRVANAFMGDKKYWKNMAAGAGIGYGLVGVGAAIAMTNPASYPVALLAVTAANTGNAVMIGNSVVQGVGLVNRAVRGNKQIDKSYAKLGNAARKNQRAGNERTRKVLTGAGSLRKKAVTPKKNKAAQMSDTSDVILSHSELQELGRGLIPYLFD